MRLDAVYPHPEDAPRTSVPDGVDLVGNAPGMLVADSWIRSARGMWLAVCSITIPYTDGRRTYHLTDQLVPGHALRPRRPSQPQRD